MVIHHDKMAYGKIKPLQDEVGNSRLTAMLKQLSAAEGDAPEKAAPAEANERRAASTPEGQKDGADGN